ncbi:MAG: hypothetical protein A4E24_00890 [Methanomethylovorans sp. PtaU1.Bin093]|uniref:flavodoxin family protein n=1 Tax=Methanomethylovorans sp. PtaU1.Bin093 TaxID=1811679 RepID=UPI0009CE7365
MGSQGNVRTVRVSDIDPDRLNGLDLLIVGSPTRAFRPTKEVTAFLNSIPANGLKNIKGAAFDTRLSAADKRSFLFRILAKRFGYAAEPIADKLVKKGGKLIVPPEWFIVKDPEGPLKSDELEHAAEWARSVIEVSLA